MLVRRWLDEAGISDAALRHCYTICVRHLATRGEGVGLAWRLQPAAARPHLAALAAHAFEADTRADTGPAAHRARQLDEYAEATVAAISSGSSADPFLHAIADTVRRFRLPVSRIEAMFAAMRRDVDFREFSTYEQFRQWALALNSGLAISLGLILGPATIARAVEPVLRELGVLFQLSDTLCDLAEDLRDGRLYLPLEDLDRFGVRAEDLRTGRWTPAVADLIAFEADRVTRHLPGLAAVAEDTLASPALLALCDYFALRVTKVLTAGAAILHQPVQFRHGELLEIWRPTWRAVIPR